MGRWYELAHNPTDFENDMTRVTADYSILENGDIEVINTGFVNGELGRYETPFEYEMDDVYAEYEILPNGIIKITNYGTDAKGTPHKAKAQATISGGGSLDVSFIPLLRFFSTPYHVIYVDKDYRHAIVSNQRGTCLWILGRAPYDLETTYESLCNIAAERGFDTKFLRLTVHHECSQ